MEGQNLVSFNNGRIIEEKSLVPLVSKYFVHTIFENHLLHYSQLTPLTNTRYSFQVKVVDHVVVPSIKYFIAYKSA